MRIIIFLFVLSNYAFSGFGQLLKIDTLLDKGIYTSYFNLKIKEPLYVTYSLFKGGGVCDRRGEHFAFKTDEFEQAATGEDYSHSGFEKGHLANAEDFAFDCDKEELTFKYYNCVPQTLKLNRGIWKTWETRTRALSSTKKIFIVAGSIFGTKKMGPNNIGVPTYCYKIVIEPSSGKIINCLLFPNNKSNTYQLISFAELKQRLGYNLVPAAFWKKISDENH